MSATKPRSPGASTEGRASQDVFLASESCRVCPKTNAHQSHRWDQVKGSPASQAGLGPDRFCYSDTIFFDRRRLPLHHSTCCEHGRKTARPQLYKGVAQVPRSVSHTCSFSGARRAAGASQTAWRILDCHGPCRLRRHARRCGRSTQDRCRGGKQFAESLLPSSRKSDDLYMSDGAARGAVFGAGTDTDVSCDE